MDRWTDCNEEKNKRSDEVSEKKKHEGLREQRKIIYLAEKARYEAAIKKEKIQFLNEYCNLTSSNPWNEVYKLAAGKEEQHTNNNSAEARLIPNWRLEKNTSVNTSHRMTKKNTLNSTN